MADVVEREHYPSSRDADSDAIAAGPAAGGGASPVSYTHLRAHETKANLVCRLLVAAQNPSV